MDRRTFIGGVVALPFAFLFKKAKAEELIEKNDCVEWLKSNQSHCSDIPTFEYADGTKNVEYSNSIEWWIKDGKKYIVATTITPPNLPKK